MSEQEVKAKGKKAKKHEGGDNGGGEQPKAPRDRTSRNFNKEAVITLLVDKNPKREGSKAYPRFSVYRDGISVGDFITGGGTYGDLAWDSARGFISISGYTPKAVVRKEKAPKAEQVPA
jgi:hypothetical protein